MSPNALQSAVGEERRVSGILMSRQGARSALSPPCDPKQTSPLSTLGILHVHLLSSLYCALLGVVSANYEENSPLFGNAFCPLVGRNGASERVSIFSRNAGGL
jgi:hypothetical protein